MWRGNVVMVLDESERRREESAVRWRIDLMGSLLRIVILFVGIAV